ncbi:ferredoxin reductase [Streptomyces sp. NPDC102406]|uniref:ferredoxin reductase n=1 Tax=Streptomyces sp. NPDC102406 TaxID=3366171 RepID=UPI0037F7D020
MSKLPRWPSGPLPPSLTGRGRWPGRRAALAAASWLTSPLSPDDYLGLLDPLWSARHPAGRVSAVRPEGPGAATLTIRPGRGWHGHRPGQYLPLGVEIDGVRHWRTYSLTSPAADRTAEVTVTVKARADGTVSPHLVHRTAPGTVLRLGPAQGEFTLPRAPRRRLLFVTAGSGITPVMGMLRTLARHPGPVPDVLLLHSAPTPDDCLFRTELSVLEKELAWLTVQVTHTRTGPRLTARRIAAACPDWRDRDAWVCGPAGLLDATERQWTAAGVRERLRLERFHLAPVLPPGADAVGGRVRFARSGTEVTAPGATPLLAVGEAAGVPMPHGCRRGICFGCLVPLLDGRVRDLRTGEQRGEPGESIQTCVSAAAGPLVLDL